MSTSLLKTLLHKTIAEGLYKEVVSRTSRYYYFLGKTISWTDDAEPPYPIDSVKYEKDCRNEIITVKEISSADLTYVVPRTDWVYNTIYDIYDDNYSTEVQGVDISNGGSYYLSPVLVISAPDETWGIQATATVVLDAGVIVGVTMVNKGSGYTAAPTVTITDSAGVDAVAIGVISKSPNGFQKLEDAKFYVMTPEFNVYKCLYNNNNAQSTVLPIGTQIDPIVFSDGYIWKYMYNVPLALRTKFLTVDQMPVITALTQEFYSAGDIQNVYVESSGTGYTFANIVLSGDGYLESDPIYLESSVVTVPGTSYADTDTIVISQPMNYSALWIASTAVPHGVRILAGDNIYEVSLAGTTNTVSPVHKFGTVANGTCTLKYMGTIAKAFPTFSAGTITTVNLLGGIREVNLVANGSGYTSVPTVTFTPPTKTFDGTVATVTVGTDIIVIGPHWFSTGDAVVYSNGGGTSITPLVHNTVYYVIKSTSTSIQLALTYADAIALTEIDLTVVGVGASHSIAQNVNATSASAILSAGGVIERVVVTNAGENYVTAPTIVIGTAWPANTVVTLGTQYFVSNRLYTVTSAGTTHASVAPTGAVKGTEYTNGTAGLTYVGTTATATCSLKYGSGYSVIPSILINTSTGNGFMGTFIKSKSEAKLIPIIENGQILSVQIDEPGIGYSSVLASVTGDGTGAAVVVNTSTGNIDTIQANMELLAVRGTINNIQMISKGYDYGSVVVTIVGDGVGATAVPVLSSGRIVDITITNPGQNYNYADVVIVGNGKAASARAIISPVGGHGKDAFTELFARTLMFYSNVSRDKNQGFTVNNDFRQLGIIKNLRGYNTTNRFTHTLGSACFVIGGTVNTSDFVQDMLLVIPRVVNTVTYYRKYRLVCVTATGLLVQSLDSDIPLVNDWIYNEAHDKHVVVLDVTNPSVDKFSGDLLFIDNKTGFTPADNEAINLRTVIKF